MSIGLGNLIGGYWSDYRTRIKNSVMWEGQKRTMSAHCKPFHFQPPPAPSLREDDLIGSHLFSGAHPDYWSQGWIESIISPAPQTMSEEWFNGQSEPIGYVMKKRSATNLWNSIWKPIMAFYPHENKEKKINAFKRSVGLPV